MVCYQFSKLVITIIMFRDNHNYKNQDDLIIVTKNNHDISIFNNNYPTLEPMEEKLDSELSCLTEEQLASFENMDDSGAYLEGGALGAQAPPCQPKYL